jgi:hypothetical protein
MHWSHPSYPSAASLIVQTLISNRRRRQCPSAAFVLVFGDFSGSCAYSPFRRSSAVPPCSPLAICSTPPRGFRACAAATRPRVSPRCRFPPCAATKARRRPPGGAQGLNLSLHNCLCPPILAVVRNSSSSLPNCHCFSSIQGILVCQCFVLFSKEVDVMA